MSDPSASAQKVTLADIYPTICEILANGSSFSIGVTGTSMYPTLIPGRDSVTISRPAAPLGKYDLPLYRRKNGAFVLHRIVSVQPDGSFVCCGDHQWEKETGVLPQQIVGVVTRIDRNGRSFPVTARGYRFWVRLWVFSLPLRRTVFRIIEFLAKIRNKARSKKPS